MRNASALSCAIGMGLFALLIGAVGCGAREDGVEHVEPDDNDGSTSSGTAGSPTGRGGSGGSNVGPAGTGGSTMTSGPGGAGSRQGAGGTGGSVGGSGGAGGQGGSGGGGSGGTPVMHIIGACDGLQPVDQFENITPPEADLSANGITQVVLDPVHAGTLYAGTDRKGLFKSINCGATWTKVNVGRNAGILDSGALWYVDLDPVDSNIIYASSLYAGDPGLFQSKNGGADFDSLFPKGSLVADTVDYNFFQWASMDPTDHRHLLVSFHANCKGPTGPECLGETKDSGATWRLFKGPLDGWGEGVGPIVLGATSWILATAQGGIYYTGDGGGSWEKVGPGLFGPLYRTAGGVYYGGSDYGTQRSPDGHTWSVVPNAPNVFAVRGDGKRLFSSQRNADAQTQQPYFTSAESDGMKWTVLPSPKMAHGAVRLNYDADHHVMYSANTTSGLWRIVTQ